ncbi:jerky protein homolog-like [Apis laboriosa]|uniref:jerky protein homolog-like n=1 Tax=Apis laboriosa TaxID=183418 RepID=UPI001CC79849|nr:jerky protein homolog-like [Apis laboriosa]
MFTYNIIRLQHKYNVFRYNKYFPVFNRLNVIISIQSEAHNGIAMASKRKRILTIEKKYKIIKNLKSESTTKLSRVHSIRKSTIIDIKKQKCNIAKYIQNVDLTDANIGRKSLTNLKNKSVDNVFQRFCQQRDKGISIYGHILREKTLEFNDRLKGNLFKANNDWLIKFKTCHGIRQLDICRKKLSTNSTAAETFRADFNKFLNNEEYELTNVYNTDETGLIWKALPQMLVSRCERLAPDHKINKECITILFCANAIGYHQLSILIIGKSKHPHYFKHVNMSAIPIVYKNQTNAWMDNIFVEWFENIFIQIKEHQLKNSHKKKVILLVDNAGCNIPNQEEFTKYMFLLPNVTSLIHYIYYIYYIIYITLYTQSLDQGVIECFKQLYRKKLLKKILFMFHLNEENMIEKYKKLNLKNCFYIVTNEWNNIKSITLKRAWKKLLMREIEEINKQERTVEANIEETITTLGRIPECDCDSDDVMQWFQCDKDNSNNEDNINFTQTEAVNESNDEDMSSYVEVFESFEKGLRWFEAQRECNSTQLVTIKNFYCTKD